MFSLFNRIPVNLKPLFHFEWETFMNSNRRLRDYSLVTSTFGDYFYPLYKEFEITMLPDDKHQRIYFRFS